LLAHVNSNGSVIHGPELRLTRIRFALGLVCANKAKGSVKTKRKAAGWNPDFLLEILQHK